MRHELDLFNSVEIVFGLPERVCLFGFQKLLR
jgi:hypothetical protein